MRTFLPFSFPLRRTCTINLTILSNVIVDENSVNGPKVRHPLSDTQIPPPPSPSLIRASDKQGTKKGRDRERGELKVNHTQSYVRTHVGRSDFPLIPR